MPASDGLEHPQRAAPAWPDRIRLPLAFDPTPLAASLDGLAPEDWVRHFVPANYEGGWSVVPLRCGARARHPIHRIGSDPSETQWVDTEYLAAMPAYAELLSAFACPLRTVRLMRLDPGSRIKPHEDVDLDLECGMARLHLPVTTNPGVEFRLNDRPVEMEAGSLWYLRLSDRHEVLNRGETPRIHLVIDARVDDWLLDLARSGDSDR